MAKTCRHFGISRQTFYSWKKNYEKLGEEGLVNHKPCPENPRLRVDPVVEEKIVNLRTTYHLGPVRICWFMQRYHPQLKVSKSGVYRVLRRRGLNRLPRNVKLRTLQTRRYEQAGCFEARFESIGGLGAHAAGQVLATAAVLRLGMNGAAFSSYGSEKKGSPIRSFVRLGPADRPIRTSAPVEAPDAIVVFHAALLASPATISGLKATGTLIINTPPGPLPESLAALPRTARVVRVNALTIAIEEKSRPNAVLLGTLCASFPFLNADQVKDALSEEFAGKHPEAVASNERAFRRGASEFETVENVGRAEGDLPPAHFVSVWGYETAPIGGIIPAAGNMVWNDLSASRTGWMPVLNKETCIHCGLCDLVCPDLCMVWGDGEPDGQYERKLMGIDYRYCKGCLRCVESCPTGALGKKAETLGLAETLRVPLYPDLIE